MGISGALIIPLTKEFGWSTEQISVALALRIVLFGLMAPFTAALIDKYGFKSVVLVALALIEIGLLRRPRHDEALASGAVLGRHRRLRHGPDRDGAGSARGDALVHRPPRPRGRDSERLERLRSAPLAAGGRLARRSIRVARRARAADCRPRYRRDPRRPLSGRQAGGRRPQALRRQRRHAGPCRAAGRIQPRVRDPVRLDAQSARSGCWRARSSFAASAPTA